VATPRFSGHLTIEKKMTLMLCFLTYLAAVISQANKLDVRLRVVVFVDLILVIMS
jgi:hypothetical protein